MEKIAEMEGVKMTTAKTKKDSVGKALYLEFRKDQYTYQVIITPHAISFENEIVSPAFMRRRVSIWHPRRNWQIDKLSRAIVPNRDAYGAFENNPIEVGVENYAENIYGYIKSQFNNLLAQDWKLYERPLVVEFSYEDLSAIQSGKTPNQLYRRIERSRKAVSWSESLFNEVAV
jgi:hypothetical protein